MIGARAAQGELAVVVSCHDVLCAIPASLIERMTLAEETPVDVEPVAAAPGLVRLGDAQLPAWDLGTLLGLAPTRSAWLLVRSGREDLPARVAIRSGPCLVVKRVERGVTLPRGLLRSHGDALPSAFRASRVVPSFPSVVGVWIDVARLLPHAEPGKRGEPARGG